MTLTVTPASAPAAAKPEPAQQRRQGRIWAFVAGIEVLIAVAAVVFDQAVPTLPLLVVASVGLLARREGFASLGFHRLPNAWRVAGQVLALTAGWTMLQLALFFPLLEHLTGQKQNVSDFSSLEGNAGELLVLLALSWTYAALGEELVFRGWIPTRIKDAFGAGAVGGTAALLGSSVLFALIHTEQGVIGVAATFLDALFFSMLRLHYRTVWASSMAHGFNNTIGLVAFWLVGPIAGLW